MKIKPFLAKFRFDTAETELAEIEMLTSHHSDFAFRSISTYFSFFRQTSGVPPPHRISECNNLVLKSVNAIVGNRVPAERFRGTRGFGEQAIPKKIRAVPRKA